MAKEYDNTNTFRLFKEDVEEGKELRLAAWVKKTQQGKTWLSGRVSELQKKPAPKAEPQSEEVPF
mgnify:CR=1 FL=1